MGIQIIPPDLKLKAKLEKAYKEEGKFPTAMQIHIAYGGCDALDKNGLCFTCKRRVN